MSPTLFDNFGLFFVAFHIQNSSQMHHAILSYSFQQSFTIFSSNDGFMKQQLALRRLQYFSRGYTKDILSCMGNLQAVKYKESCHGNWHPKLLN